jgi:probable F420-dependent oxidoreductase
MNKNAVGEERRYWGFAPIMEASMIGMIAKQAEDNGMAGLFAAQVYGPPFIPLAAAATTTQTIKLATGIAIAAARSPTETAMAALDMDRLTNGRFTLGLGSSVSAWTSGIFGSPPIKPLAHIRETVAAVRHIVANYHTHLEPFDGQYFSADFKEISQGPPPVRESIPIWIAALREKLTRLAVEIGDGVIGHPMWSVEWATEQMAPVIQNQLELSGRDRTEIEVSIWPWVAPNPDEKAALDDARPTIAFYAGVAQYESFFEAHGFKKEAQACQKGVQQADFMSAVDKVPDEMVRCFVAVGDIDQVLERIEPLWGIANSLCIAPPAYSMTPEKQMYYADQIGQLIAKSKGV